jgi:hypothetical protein
MALNYEDDVYARTVDIAFEDRRPVLSALADMGIQVAGRRPMRRLA